MEHIPYCYEKQRLSTYVYVLVLALIFPYSTITFYSVPFVTRSVNKLYTNFSENLYNIELNKATAYISICDDNISQISRITGRIAIGCGLLFVSIGLGLRMKFRDICFPALAVLSIGPVLLWMTAITDVKYRGKPQIRRQTRSSDNTSRTVGPASQTKVFCWITSMEKDLKTKIPAVNETWARKCDNKIFIMTTKKMIKNKQIIDLKVPDGRKHLTEKTIAALQHLYDHYLDDHDWFLKSDDDTYIIMENLRYLLSHYNPKEPVYLGHLFKKFSRAGYMSGGAGYILSKQALRVLVESGYRNGTTCPKNGSDEDVDLAACLYKVGVPVHNTLDRYGRETFHPFSATQHLVGDLPPLLGNWDRNPTKKGAECCSELSISYHYTSPNLMRTIDFLLYKTSVYGRNTNQSHFEKFFQIGTVPPLKQPPK